MTHGEKAGLRLPPELSAAIDEWVSAQPDPKPSRSAGIRQLIKIGLLVSLPERTASLDEQIARKEKTVAVKIPEKPSPEKGMAKLRKGLAENDLRKLIAKKRRGSEQ